MSFIIDNILALLFALKNTIKMAAIIIIIIAFNIPVCFITTVHLSLSLFYFFFKIYLFLFFFSLK